MSKALFANRHIIRMAETLRFGVSTMLVSTERDGYFALLQRLEVTSKDWLAVPREIAWEK